MNDFMYSYPVKVYFGTDAAKKAISKELEKYGKQVILAYGGGSVKMTRDFSLFWFRIMNIRKILPNGWKSDENIPVK